MSIVSPSIPNENDADKINDKKLDQIEYGDNASISIKPLNDEISDLKSKQIIIESDFYTMCKGGTGVDQQSIPSFTSVAKKVAARKSGVIGDVVAKIPNEVPFTQPLKGQLPINIA